MNKAHVSDGEFVVTSGDPSEVLDPFEEVLDQMSASIASPGVRLRTLSVAARWDAGSDSLPAKPMAKVVRVIAFISDKEGSRDVMHDALSVRDVCIIPRTEKKRDGSAATIDDRVNLGIKPSFGSPKSLMVPASGGVGGTAVCFDVRGVDEMLSISGRRGNDLPKHFPEPFLTPSSIVLVDRIPVRLWSIDRSPFTTLAKHDENASQDKIQRERRSPAAAFLLPPGFLIVRCLWFLLFPSTLESELHSSVQVPCFQLAFSLRTEKLNPRFTNKP